MREVLADLRPDVVARAEFAQWQLSQGVSVGDLYEPTRRVPERWRDDHVLIQLELEREGPLADIDDVGLRTELERTHRDLLRAHGMAHLDISEIRSKSRVVTQAISRDLYDQGVAGLIFRSNLDDGRCLVLFEGRGVLEQIGEATSLADELQVLREVCEEYGLLL